METSRRTGVRRRWWRRFVLATVSAAGLVTALPGAAGVAPGGAPAGAVAEDAISGRVLLMNRRGSRPARSVSAEDVVVVYRPDGLASRWQPTERRFELETIDKEYVPHVMAVPRGAEVHFPNRDEILHNVFSVSGANRFDLDLVEGGQSRSHTFESPGLVRVFCNVHRDMVAYLWVLETPHWTRPDSSGRFRLDGVPAGRGRLTIWHERGDTVEVDVRVGDPAQDHEVLITRPRLPSHSRKDGTAYRTREVY